MNGVIVLCFKPSVFVSLKDMFWLMHWPLTYWATETYPPSDQQGYRGHLTPE
jgi:hypothetical protein